MKVRKIEISNKTIIFTVGFLISLALCWYMREVIATFFVCVMCMEALNPAVSRLEKFKIPRVLAIILLYILILTAISFAVAGIVPALVEQTTSLVKTLPETVQGIKIFGTSAIDLSSQFKILETLPSDIATAAFSFFGNIFSGFVVMMVTLYMLLERKNISKYVGNAFGDKWHTKTDRILELLQARMGSWVSAMIFLMTLIGVLSYFGYLILGLKYAVPLAIIAGLLEIVPTIGPTIAAILAGLVGLTVSPLTGALAVIWGVVIQQLENNFIVPKLMKESVGINPLITIFLLLAGAKLGGVMGALLSVPLYLTAEIIIKVVKEKSADVCQVPTKAIKTKK